MDERIQEAESFLDAMPRYADAGAEAYRPGLERAESLLELMGNPHRGLRFIHVAGTNGKGSTASMIAAIGTAAGRRTGLHTSPHLFNVTERMRIDGRPAPREWLASMIDQYREGIEEVGPSYFELTVVLSFLFFAASDVELAVVEVGMGGRFDATNIIRPELSVITDIGLDHVEHLGGSIAAIAHEKAGIIKSGVPVVCGAAAEAASVIRNAADAAGSEFHDVAEETKLHSSFPGLRGTGVTLETPVRVYNDLFIDLPGEHQIRNARAAVRAAELALRETESDQRPIFEGMRHVRELTGLRARLEVLRDDPLIVADVGHNVDGLATALAHLRNVGRLDGRLTVLFGVMRDKDVKEMARLLAAADALVRPVALTSPRALSSGELGEVLQVCDVDTGEPCTVEEGIKAFLSDASHADILLITGSHLVVSQLEDASV